MSIALLIIFSLIVMLAMFPVGIILIVISRRPGLPYPSCGGCMYDLTGITATTDTCPECGELFTTIGINPPRKRRRRTYLVTGIILTVVPFLLGGLFLLGVSTAAVSSSRARTQAVLAQQQAQTQALAQQRAQLTEELAALREQLDGLSDEAMIKEVEEAIAEVQNSLDQTQAEHAQMTPDPAPAPTANDE